MIENPNELKPDAYAGAVSDLQYHVGDAIDRCWRAGGSIDNIEDEMGSALAATESFSGRTILVTISVG